MDELSVAVGQVWASADARDIAAGHNQVRVVEALTSKTKYRRKLFSAGEWERIERPAVRFVTEHHYHNGRFFGPRVRTHRSTVLLDKRGRPAGHRFVAHSLNDLQEVSP